MREFLIFCRNFLRLLRYVRGVLLALFLVLFICALLIGQVEGKGLGEALYFTFVTGLTIGYGDIVPVTAAGRLLSIVAGVVGVIFVGIVVAVATRALRDAVEEEKAIRTKKN